MKPWNILQCDVAVMFVPHVGDAKWAIRWVQILVFRTRLAKFVRKATCSHSGHFVVVDRAYFLDSNILFIII